MKYKDLAEQLLKCCLALKKDNELQTKKIKAQAEVIETSYPESDAHQEVKFPILVK